MKTNCISESIGLIVAFIWIIVSRGIGHGNLNNKVQFNISTLSLKTLTLNIFLIQSLLSI